ncbi:lysM domain-containing GPI-anchored protein 1-like isoform X2 [Olea europaea var. sylvestris]|uniref:lysM domain-containing GPI-anchored protein 1-like isoform X2 n=1 Tax=Olea europaea var. sylvestris TaxID=158386 RepID=UPI000C1CE349|nr:lysM domain-containing GPI-anchored protein 1-like isoform X2 [Olea europaea var. sylvestris]
MFKMASRNAFTIPIFVLYCFTTFFSLTTSKSTIEPCSNSDTCSALVGYTLYTDLKVSEVASLFSVDPISLLLSNSIDISYPDVENHILPSQLFLKIPIPCSCVDGIRKSSTTSYKTRPSDTLASIATAVYGGLISADQINEANPDAARYFTTLTDLMNMNQLGSPAIKEGDILAIPLSACASKFPKYALDYGLFVPNGSYAITASHCVQCSCGPGSRNLYCTPASLAVSCSSMQCRSSNLMLGNVTTQQSSAGCNVTSCSYGGFVNGSITTWLSSSLQPRCPGSQQFPQLIAPPTVVPDSLFSPAPSPSEAGGFPTMNPKSSVVPSSGAGIGFPPANGPAGSASGTSDARALMNNLYSFSFLLTLGLVFKFLLSIPL